MTSSPLVKTVPAGFSEVLRQKRNPTIEDFHFPDGLPTADDLPCSDDKPVDNELQTLIPNLLYNVLLDLWGHDRNDWLFSIDMGFYYDPAKPAIAPDGMLCPGIQPPETENLRSSYVLWQEKVIPLFAFEIVSKTPGKERTKKKDIFESVGVLYYLVYAPLLKRKVKFHLYKLIEGTYVLQSAGHEPYWMPEVGLAIALGAGFANGTERQFQGIQEREWLFWYDENNVRYLTPIERAEMERTARMAAEQQADLERVARMAIEQQNAALRQRLSELGIDPNSL
jgi:Putative restriction endonuclease